MKTLKFAPDLVEKILLGEKTSTFRLFDDKDLKYGDELIFINKETGKEFGTATITSLKIKTLASMTEGDWVGHEKFSSDEEMYATYRKYYGDKVDGSSEVKILTFDFSSNQQNSADVDPLRNKAMNRVKLNPFIKSLIQFVRLVLKSLLRFLKAYVIKKLFIEQWAEFKKFPLTKIANLVFFLAACITIWQIPIITTQLHQLNATADIHLTFRLNSMFVYGPEFSEPLELNVRAINKGEKMATVWRAVLQFCKDINVVESDLKWAKLDSVNFALESQKPTIPMFPGRFALYVEDLDTIGKFKIIIANKSKTDFNKPIPIAIASVSGDYPNPTQYLVTLTPNTINWNNSGFSYTKLLDEKGRMISSYKPTTTSCIVIIDEQNILS